MEQNNSMVILILYVSPFMVTYRICRCCSDIQALVVVRPRPTHFRQPTFYFIRHVIIPRVQAKRQA